MRLTVPAVFVLVEVAAVLIVGSLTAIYHHHLAVWLGTGSSSCGGG
ncbi:MAG TPA: hypothetical protein VLR46_07020 [Candidatus Dormibacteraeota bacterium]|nr:hypothetical protein [Candidatus Dormibacteraeota bacterium]